MKNRIMIAVVLLLHVGANLQAQTRSLTMSEALLLSLQNSRQLKISYAKLEEAHASQREAKNNRLPELKASGAYLRLNTPDVNLKVKLGNNSGGEQQSASPKVDQIAYGMVNGSLPLFSGFRIKYGVEAAKYLEKAAALDVDNDREEVLQNTINAYANLYKAMKSVDLVKQNLTQQELRLKDFSNMEQNGLMARNDLLKAQLQKSNIELSLLEAESNYKLACININLMLGLPEDQLLVADSASFVPPPSAQPLAGYEDVALQQRKDLQSLNYHEHAAQAGIKAAKGEYYPGLALTGGYVAADVPTLLTLNNALNIGVGLQYNMSSLWKAGAKIDVAKARLHQVQAAEGITQDKIRMQVSQAYQNYLLATKRIDVYARATEQAADHYRITKNKHTNNLVTTTDLLDADLAQLQAQLNHALASVDAVVAYTKLLHVTGLLDATDINITK